MERGEGVAVPLSFFLNIRPRNFLAEGLPIGFGEVGDWKAEKSAGVGVLDPEGWANLDFGVEWREVGRRGETFRLRLVGLVLVSWLELSDANESEWAEEVGVPTIEESLLA